MYYQTYFNPGIKSVVKTYLDDNEFEYSFTDYDDEVVLDVDIPEDKVMELEYFITDEEDSL
jgi:hypothetical protein